MRASACLERLPQPTENSGYEIDDYIHDMHIDDSVAEYFKYGDCPSKIRHFMMHCDEPASAGHSVAYADITPAPTSIEEELVREVELGEIDQGNSALGRDLALVNDPYSEERTWLQWQVIDFIIKQSQSSYLTIQFPTLMFLDILQFASPGTSLCSILGQVWYLHVQGWAYNRISCYATYFQIRAKGC